MGAILKQITFTDQSALILSIQPQSRVLIQWKLAPSTQQLSRLRFYVDRGESPESLKPLGPFIASDRPCEFIDYTAGLIDIYRLYWYRVRAVEFDGTNEVQTFQTEPFTWDGEQDLTGIYIVEEFEFAHRYVYGVPALVYKRIRDGIYCPECFDFVLKRMTKSSCKTCYGTGKVGGFYPPIEDWVEMIEPVADAPSITERGDKQSSQTAIRLTNYPIVADGDIILELQQNRYWKVARVTLSEKHHYPVLQLCNVSEVGRNDIEQYIQVDDAVRRRLVAELVAQRKEREH